MQTATAFSALPRRPLQYSTVHSVHGSPGITGWKALYTRRHLLSRTEAIEWATLPPCAVSGEHFHSRTEEIYLILDGEGSIALNGRLYAVKPGTLVLTPPGNSHGLRNDHNGVLNWVVIESLSVAMQQAIDGSGKTTHEKDSHMTTRIYNLRETPFVSTSEVFRGPILSIERVLLNVGKSVERSCDYCEQAVYVNKGSVKVQQDDNVALDVRAPCSLLLPYETRSRITAQTDVELFITILKVDKVVDR